MKKKVKKKSYKLLRRRMKNEKKNKTLGYLLNLNIHFIKTSHSIVIQLKRLKHIKLKEGKKKKQKTKME
jgi:hypothetical protein